MTRSRKIAAVLGKWGVVALLTMVVCSEKPAAVETAVRPNIILISLDTFRVDHLSLYGYDRPTSPNLAEIAKEGLLFKQAYSTSSWTHPSHASVFTGLFPRQHGCITQGHKIRDDVPTLAEELSNNGYYTAAFVETYILLPNFGFARGFKLYDNKCADFQKMMISDKSEQDSFGYTDTVSAEIVTNKAKRWLQRNKENPFFLFVHYFDAHHKYKPPDKYKDTFPRNPNDGVTGDLPQLEKSNFSDGQRQTLISLYDGEIASVDAQLGRLFEEFETLGLLESSVVIIFGDHGEEFNDHGKYFHAHTVYEELVRVPLLVRWPGQVAPDTTYDDPVSIRQIHDTIRVAAGLPKTNDKLPTLVETTKHPEPAPRFFVAGSLDTQYRAEFVRFGDMKLIRNFNRNKPEKYELYNLKDDPGEKTDLADPKTAGTYRKLMIRELGEEDKTPDTEITFSEEEMNLLRGSPYLSSSGIRSGTE